MTGRRQQSIAIILAAALLAISLPLPAQAITLTGATPTANPDAYTTTADPPVTPLVANAPGVLANDGGGGLTAILVSGPSHATSFTLNANGSFTYTPTAGFNGTDTFTYKAHNAAGDSSPATVTITVSHVNLAPTITAPGAQTVFAGAPLTFTGGSAITVNDADAAANPIKVTLTMQHGTLTLGSTAGVTVTGDGTGSVSVTGPQASINTAMSGMIYTSLVTYSGAETLAIHADDQGNTGSGGAKTADATVAITVTAVPVTHFAVTAPASATAGTAFTFTVTAQDAGNATVALYRGTVHFTSTDPSAVVPADYTFVAGDNGVHTFTNAATLKTAGNRTITATDTIASSLTGTSANIAVVAAAATHLSVTTPASATAGTAFSVTVTAQDQFNNTATGYGGTVHFTSSDGTASLPGDNTLTSGTGTFSATLRTTGSQTITATDTITSSITGTSNTITVGAGGATHFTVSAPASATAGVPFSVTVTALDQFNNTVTGYAGTVHFTSTDGLATLPGNTTLTNGTGSFSATLSTSGTQTITATDTVTSSITGTSNSIIVSAAAATHFAVTAPASATAGTAFSVTVTALDQFNNTATGYTGTVHFTSSDGQAVLPGNSTLTSGTGTFSATLKTAGNQTITATDTITSSITGASNTIAVNPGAATHFIVSAPSGATAGVPFSVTVTAQDQFNNTATGYAGTVHFTSSDGTASLPGDNTLTSGTGTFSATLRTTGSQTITATDTITSSITGTSNTITVGAGGATHFTVSAPASATAGVPFSVTVTALDQFNNTVTGYAGTVHFTSTDGLATLPGDNTLTNGTGSFSATLSTSGTQTITATDTVTSSITGTSNSIIVSAAAATHFTVSAPASATAGVPFSVTVTALDQFNNTATGYTGTVTFSKSDTGTGSAIPANYAFVAGDNGVHTFTNGATLVTVGSQTITATDTVTSSITGTASITVSPAATNHLLVAATSPQTAGSAFSVTVTAQDQFNNTTPAYTGTIHFTTSDTGAGSAVPANYTFNGGDAGVHIFPNGATLVTAGTRSITATDTVTSSITGAASITVNPGAATHFLVTAPASVNTGQSFSVTVTAQDAFNNTVTGYAGTVHFTSTDGTASLPVNSPLTNGVGSFSVTLNTTGNQTITATDTVTSSITGTSGTINVINQAPQVIGSPKESFDTVGNTVFEFKTVQTASPGIFVSGNLVANFTDPEGDPITAVAQTNAPTANGGKVTLATNGEFTFTPKAGDTAASDTFTYQVQDNHGNTTSPRSVTITLKGRVWYVKNNVSGAGTGISSDPFQSLASAATASLTGDYLFVYGGDLTTAHQNAGVTLKANQKLYGEAFGLTVTVTGTLNGGSGPVTLVPSNLGNQPKITNTGGVGVSVPSVAGVEIRGLDIAGNTNAVGATTASGASTSATITNNVISSAGANGIDARTSAGATALTLDVSNNSPITATGTGIFVDGSAGGTTTITGFANNAVGQNTVGTGISINKATFDGTPGGNYQQVSGGTTVIGASGNGVGASGMVLTNVSGDLTFTDLDIFADGGAAFRLTGNGAVNTSAGTGTRVTVGVGVAVFEAVGGPAVDVTNATIDLQLSSLKSTNSPTTGVNLDTAVDGTTTAQFSAGSGSTISGSSGTAFRVNGSNATISYAGTISSVTAGSGIVLTSNTSATIDFTGALTLSTAGNAAFSATGGGTVTATNTTSTLTTTTGTALNVANTTIGASGLTFKSIAANGAASGIVLNTTGNGGLTVTGDGASDTANTTRGRTTAKNGGGTIALGSGGTIVNTTGPAVSLTSASNVTLRNLSLTGNSGGLNSGADGIHAQTVTSLTLDNVLVTGHLGNDGLFGSEVVGLTLMHTDIHTNAKTSGVEGLDIWDVRLDNLTGTCAVTNSLFFDAAEDIFTITNSDAGPTAHTLGLTVTNSEFRDTSLATAPAVGNTAFAVILTGSSNTVSTINATGSTFKNVKTTGFQYAGSSANSSGTVNVMNNVFGGTAAGGDAGNQNGVDIDISHQGQGTTLNFEVSGNTTRQGFRANDSSSININMGGLATATTQMIGTVKNNIIGIAGVANSGSDLGAGIGIDAKGAATMTVSVTGNTVNQVRANSGNVFDTATSQTAKLNLFIHNNTFNGNPAQVNPQYGIHVNAGTGTPGENIQACIDMAANSVTMPASAIASIDLDAFPGTTTKLVGYTGAATNGTQIQNFFGSNPGTTPPGVNTTTTPATLFTAAGGTVLGGTCGVTFPP